MREVRVSSPDRVLWPAAGMADGQPVTKLDLAAYLVAVGDPLLRALGDPIPELVAAHDTRRARTERHGQRAGQRRRFEPVVGVVTPFGVEHPAEPGDEDAHDVLEEEHQNRGFCTQLDDSGEGRAGVLAEEPRREDPEMTG